MVIRFNSDHRDCLGNFNLLLKGLVQLRGTTSAVDLIGPIGPSGSRYGHFGLSDRLRRKDPRPCRPHSTLDMQGLSSLPSARAGTDHRDEDLIRFHDGARKFGFTEPARVRVFDRQGMANDARCRRRPGEPCHLGADLGKIQDLRNVPAYAAVCTTLTESLAHHLARQMDESPRARLLV